MNTHSLSTPPPEKTTAGRRTLALAGLLLVAVASACGGPAEPAKPAAEPETAAAKNAATEAPHDDSDGHGHNPDGSHVEEAAGHGHGPDAGHSHGKRTLSRTEASARVENFFEYEPLKAGRPGQLLLHLTDTTKGGPVADATVTVTARSVAGAEVATATAQRGKRQGIYSAELAIPTAGSYDLEFHVKTDAIDERIAAKGIAVE